MVIADAIESDEPAAALARSVPTPRWCSPSRSSSDRRGVRGDDARDARLDW